MYIRAEQIDYAYTGTLEWLYRDDHVTEPNGPGIVPWLRNGEGAFWIQGKPGSGKSTVMKHLVSSEKTARLLSSDGAAGPWILAGLFFTDRGGQSQRSWLGMLHSMLYQLVNKVPDLLPTIITYCLPPRELSLFHRPKVEAIKTSEFVWTVDKLESALLACKSCPSARFRICFFIDALDEHAGDHEEMGEFLKVLASVPHDSSQGFVKVCAASRPLNQLKDLFDNCPGFKMQDWTVKDINHYITERVRSHLRMRVLLTKTVHAQAINRLVWKINERANGVFLWVRLVVDDLSKSLTDGESIEALELHLSSLPDDLDIFYRHMLSKVDSRYSRECFIMLESVMRARKPLTVIHLALVLHSNTRTFSSTIKLTGQSHFCNLLALLTFSPDSSVDIERQIRSYSGGMLELKPPGLSNNGGLGESPPPSRPQSSSSRGSSQNSGRDSIADSLQDLISVNDCESGLYVGNWTVLPLHQTVREFLREPENIIASIKFQASSEQISHSGIDGHYYILNACLSWLRLPKKQDIPMILSDQEILLNVAYHSPCAERAAEGTLNPNKTTYDLLLDDLDDSLSTHFQRGDYWPYEWIILKHQILVKNHWGFDFLAFAVLFNMTILVERRLKEELINVRRTHHLPLLHFSVICFSDTKGTPLRPEMTQLLLDHGAEAGLTYHDRVGRHDMDALAFLLSSCKDSQSLDMDDVIQVAHMLLEQGADPNGFVWQSGGGIRTWESTPLAACRLNSSPRQRFSLLKELISHGAQPNTHNWQGETVLEALFQGSLEDAVLPFEGWVWLLDHGARITKPMVEGGLGIFADSRYKHALRDPRCRHPKYYDWRARHVAWKYNPSWSEASVFPKHWLYSMYDRLVPQVGLRSGGASNSDSDA